jgi:hypothetical protein
LVASTAKCFKIREVAMLTTNQSILKKSSRKCGTNQASALACLRGWTRHKRTILRKSSCSNSRIVNKMAIPKDLLCQEISTHLMSRMRTIRIQNKWFNSLKNAEISMDHSSARVNSWFPLIRYRTSYQCSQESKKIKRITK